MMYALLSVELLEVAVVLDAHRHLGPGWKTLHFHFGEDHRSANRARLLCRDEIEALKTASPTNVIFWIVQHLQSWLGQLSHKHRDDRYCFQASAEWHDHSKHNRSLSELTNVILALLQKQDHIPYRNSKLTHLLMPSLGGNSKTLMFINVAPFLDCFVESVKSLRFAVSVNSCKMAKAKRNRFLNTSSSNSSSFDK